MVKMVLIVCKTYIQPTRFTEIHLLFGNGQRKEDTIFATDCTPIRN